jgi:hypothetical protein
VTIAYPIHLKSKSILYNFLIHHKIYFGRTLKHSPNSRISKLINDCKKGYSSLAATFNKQKTNPKELCWCAAVEQAKGHGEWRSPAAWW